MSTKVHELFQQLKYDHQDRKTKAVARSTLRGKTAKAFISQPMAHDIGSVQKGLQLADGNFLVDGNLIRDPGGSIWNIDSDNTAFQKKAQGFFWLDHLAANGSADCAATARSWFAEWLVRFGDGHSFAWTPELAGARIISMVNHAIILMGNTTEEAQKNYFASISHHARFLKKQWQSAPEGLPRFRALVGYVYSALALEEFAKDLKPALRALTRECEDYFIQGGGIPTRNPEALLDIFTLLVWVNQGMTSASLHPDRALLKTIESIAPAIRTLRLGDGTLAEFHGGRGLSAARIDQIISDSGSRATFTEDKVMGYSRIEKSTAVLIMDSGLAPDPERQAQAFDCALAFAFSSGGNAIFKGVGSGRDLSDLQQKATRAASAFTVAALYPDVSEAAALAANTDVTFLRSESMSDATTTIAATHTGYRAAFGVSYDRTLKLIENGYALSGVDRFYCKREKDRRCFDKVTLKRKTQSIPFAAIFHIAPDVEAVLDLGGTAVSLQLPNNEMWIFKAVGGRLALKDSLYFTPDRIRPRATKQIVVTSHIVNYEGEINWMLTRLEG
ncbi:MAG: heparinase II/III family protein [Proteobacteria bacterium]|nr:heparinase II/III family protein [Pseudomonadota bacterium]